MTCRSLADAWATAVATHLPALLAAEPHRFAAAPRLGARVRACVAHVLDACNSDDERARAGEPARLPAVVLAYQRTFHHVPRLVPSLFASTPALADADRVHVSAALVLYTTLHVLFGHRLASSARPNSVGADALATIPAFVDARPAWHYEAVNGMHFESPAATYAVYGAAPLEALEYAGHAECARRYLANGVVLPPRTTADAPLLAGMTSAHVWLHTRLSGIDTGVDVLYRAVAEHTRYARKRRMLRHFFLSLDAECALPRVYCGFSSRAAGLVVADATTASPSSHCRTIVDPRAARINDHGTSTYTRVLAVVNYREAAKTYDVHWSFAALQLTPYAKTLRCTLLALFAGAADGMRARLMSYK